jgi:glutamate synthase (NADPH/NADH) small chain
MSGADVHVGHPEVAQRFPDLHPPLDPQSALVEANRCLFCFDAPCTAACPTHIDVPRFIKKISTDNIRGSALTILDANILGASCSRVCPVDVLCEGACVLNRYNQKPIEIGRLQRFVMDDFLSKNTSLPIAPRQELSKRVACIGAGPASLACAAELRKHGYQVTIFERRGLPGGLNTYGVAEYKLRASDSLREIELIQSLGVEFQFGVDVTGAIADIEKEYDLVFIGVGLGSMKTLGIPGESLPGVVDALKFISWYKTGYGSQLIRVGSDVVVVGAGNTAIDAANASRRLGAERVHILYRRDQAHMSAFDFEYEHAKQEGVQFLWFSQPTAIHADEDTGVVASIECVHTVSGTSFRLPCNLVIPAIGQSPLLKLLSACQGVQLDGGRVVVNRKTGQTSNPKFFAGGDCVNGGREVVDAVADGKRAGAAMAMSLEVLEAVHA